MPVISRQVSWLPVTLIGAAAVLWSVAVFAALTAEPEMLFFSGHSDTHALQVFAENQPVSSLSVDHWKFYSDSSSYPHMIQVEFKDGRIYVKTTERSEDGSYFLVVATSLGELRVPVRITLPSASPTAYADTGTTGVKLRSTEKRIPLLELESFYLEGTRLYIDMGCAPEYSACWWINNEIVSKDSRLLISLDQPGPLHVVYEERCGNQVVAQAEARSEVLPRGDETVPFSTKINARNTFKAPPGYAQHKWYVNNEFLSELENFRHTFLKAGAYQVKVNVAAPDDTSLPSRRTIIYEVTVAP